MDIFDYYNNLISYDDFSYRLPPYYMFSHISHIKTIRDEFKRIKSINMELPKETTPPIFRYLVTLRNGRKIIKTFYE